MVRRVKREVMANGKSVMGMDEGTVGDQEGGTYPFLAKCFEEAWSSQGRLPVGDDTGIES